MTLLPHGASRNIESTPHPMELMIQSFNRIRLVVSSCFCSLRQNIEREVKRPSRHGISPLMHSVFADDCAQPLVERPDVRLSSQARMYSTVSDRIFKALRPLSPMERLPALFGVA
jgi:hypothetical protein